jgi:hypothetical protein
MEQNGNDIYVNSHLLNDSSILIMTSDRKYARCEVWKKWRLSYRQSVWEPQFFSYLAPRTFSPPFPTVARCFFSVTVGVAEEMRGTRFRKSGDPQTGSRYHSRHFFHTSHLAFSSIPSSECLKLLVSYIFSFRLLGSIEVARHYWQHEWWCWWGRPRDGAEYFSDE